MSATGRGTVRDEKDFYATPKAAFEPLLTILPMSLSRDTAISGYWEPCAGDGRLIHWLRESGRVCDGADLEHRTACYGNLNNFVPGGVDYLKDIMQRDFVITNPPFSLAFAMCQHALAHSREFIFLLRLSFLESDSRGDWLTAHEPNGLWVLRKRPSFVMSVTCKSGGLDPHGNPCKHNWLLPIESARPKVCPVCGGDRLAISTSDNSGYAWFYWGPRAELSGIHHL